MGVGAALLLLPLIGPANPRLSVAESASRQPRRVAPVDPLLGVEPTPSWIATVFGAPGDLPVGPEPGPGLIDRAGQVGALATSVGADLPAGPLGIPGTALLAYENAAGHLREVLPGCGLDWSLLAAIGRIESGHASGGRVDRNGRTLRPILGPALNGGPGIAAIADTDGGALDGDTRWDRAVGPMQFIPSTWASYAADGNGDGQRDPHNVFDAAVGAGRLLCAGGVDLRDPVQRARAVFRYNHSDSYVATVLAWADGYAKRVTPVEVPPGAAPPPGLPLGPLVIPPQVLPALPPGGDPAASVRPVLPPPTTGPAPGEPPAPPPPPPGPATTTTTLPSTTVPPTTVAPPPVATTVPTTATTTVTVATTVTTSPPQTTTTTVPACPPPGAGPTSTTTTTTSTTSSTTTTVSTTTTTTTTTTTGPGTTVPPGC